MYTAGIDNYLG